MANPGLFRSDFDPRKASFVPEKVKSTTRCRKKIDFFFNSWCNSLTDLEFSVFFLAQIWLFWSKNCLWIWLFFWLNFGFFGGQNRFGKGPFLAFFVKIDFFWPFSEAISSFSGFFLKNGQKNYTKNRLFLTFFEKSFFLKITRTPPKSQECKADLDFSRKNSPTFWPFFSTYILIRLY